VRHPEVELITGGGVRDADDLAALRQSGVAGVLVASALHDGRLTGHDLAAERDCRVD
jgi:phosphoribosylformimino-5-aminoimidazole carboxamide ribotide isomerase